MRLHKWWLAVLCIALSVFSILGFVVLVSPARTFAQVPNAPAQPGVAISTGVSAHVDAGEVVTYYHAITNTGDTTALYNVAASASQKWPLDIYLVQYPAGTTILLPFSLQAGEVTTVAVRLTVPEAVRPGIINTTTVTATVMATMGPYAHAVAYDTAVVVRNVYFPLVIKDYDPFINGDFSAGLKGWTITGILGGSLAIDPDHPSNGVGLVGNPAFPCSGVPLGYGSLNQSFVAPQAPPGKSIHIVFRYRIFSNDYNLNLSGEYDTFDVLVNGVLKLRDANRSYFNYCNVPPYDLGWRTGDLDLGVGGRPVVLAFQVHNRLDKFYNTYVLVDDVDFIVVD